MAQLMCYQPPVVPFQPGRREQSLPRHLISQGQSPSTASERTFDRTETEKNSNPPNSQYQTKVISLISLEQRDSAMENRTGSPATPSEVGSWTDMSAKGEVTGGLNNPHLTLPGAKGDNWGSETATPVEISEVTAQVANATFKQPLANTARQTLGKQFGIPKLDTTRCPELDMVIKRNLSKKVKDADSQLARIHTLILDAMAPLVQVIEEAASSTLTAETATKAAKTALSLISNISYQMAKIDVRWC